MDRNPKAYQVLAIGSCPKEIKTELCINEPLIEKRLPYLPGVRNFHGIASKPSHNIHTLHHYHFFIFFFTFFIPYFILVFSLTSTNDFSHFSR